MYKLFALLLLIGLSAFQQAPAKKRIQTTYKVFANGSWVDAKLDAEPMLGTEPLGLDKFILKNLRYPMMAQRAGVTGEVLITAEITEKGEIVNERIAKNVSHGLGEEALRVIKLIPDELTPATLNGQPIRTQVTFPLRFQIK